MSDKTYKNTLDNGYTTYHDDGTKSVTYKNLLDNGTTTYHQDGSKSKTYKNMLDNGYTTYHDDGTKSVTYKNYLDNGTTTYHQDGSRSRTYRNSLDNGYTTYHENRNTSSYSSSGEPISSYGYQTDTSHGTSYLYYGGGFSSYADYAGAKEIIVTVFWAFIACAALWWYTTELPMIMLTVLAAVIIFGMVQRNKYRDRSRQSIWYMWSMLLATLVGFYMVQHKASSPEDPLIAIIFWAMPLVYTIIMFYTCDISSGDLNNLMAAFGLTVLVVISWIATIYRNYGGDYIKVFYCMQDVLFIIVLVVAVITLIVALVDCRISSISFIFVCAFIYLMGKELTGFKGLSIIKELISNQISG